MSTNTVSIRSQEIIDGGEACVLVWGAGIAGYDTETGQLIVAIDARNFRPTEVETLLGDTSKAKEKLGWESKITLQEIVHEMMENDINIAKRDSLIREHGFDTTN